MPSWLGIFNASKEAENLNKTLRLVSIGHGELGHEAALLQACRLFLNKTKVAFHGFDIDNRRHLKFKAEAFDEWLKQNFNDVSTKFSENSIPLQGASFFDQDYETVCIALDVHQCVIDLYKQQLDLYAKHHEASSYEIMSLACNHGDA